jgi:hypothetical protein
MGGGSVRRGYATTSQTRGSRESDERQWCNEKWGHRQMGGGGMRRGDTATSWTRGMRGNRTTRSGGASRWEMAAMGEVMQQLAR